MLAPVLATFFLAVMASPVHAGPVDVPLINFDPKSCTTNGEFYDITEDNPAFSKWGRMTASDQLSLFTYEYEGDGGHLGWIEKCRISDCKGAYRAVISDWTFAGNGEGEFEAGAMTIRSGIALAPNHYASCGDDKRNAKATAEEQRRAITGEFPASAEHGGRFILATHSEGAASLKAHIGGNVPLYQWNFGYKGVGPAKVIPPFECPPQAEELCAAVQSGAGQVTVIAAGDSTLAEP